MRAFRRLALNRVDLILGIVSLFFLTLIVGVVIWFDDEWHFLPNDTETRKAVVGAIFAGWLTIALACAGGAVRITASRQSLISLLSSEIKAIQDGLFRMNMFGFWKDVYDDPEKGTFGFADVPREENYFEIYHSVSNNIGNLHPRVVESIVSFYTYLKMSRDAAAGLKSWEKQTDPAVRRLHVRYVVNLLGFSMFWGFVALRFMGFRANEQEKSFLQEIKVAYEKVVGPDQYERLWADQKDALEDFFEMIPLGGSAQ